MAHRDGTGADANDNASGTAALIELARCLRADGRRATDQAPVLARLPLDGRRSRRRARRSPFRSRARNARQRHRRRSISTRIAGRAGRGSCSRGDTARSPAPGLVETARAALAKESGGDPSRPSGAPAALDLAFPFNPYEQAPFVSRGIPAVTMTTAGAGRRRRREGGRTARHPAPSSRSAGRRRTRSTRWSRASRSHRARRATSSSASGSIRGWAIEIVLVAMLLPFLAAAVDLFARCRRRRIRIAPALRSYRSRLGFWAWVGAALPRLRRLSASGERRRPAAVR